MFGRQWRGLDSDWDKLGEVRSFVEKLRTAVRVGDVEEALVGYLETDPDALPLPGLIAAMEQSRTVYQEQQARLFDLLKLDVPDAKCMDRGMVV